MSSSTSRTDSGANSVELKVKVEVVSPQQDIEPPWLSTIRLNDGINNTNGLSNEISTTKYNIFSWLPKSLWEQFRRIANIYFLVISLLMVN